MELSELPKDKKIILFDGICNLCDSMVQFVIRHDKKDVFRFDSLQSENGIKILENIGANPKALESVVLYVPGVGHFEKSDAALEILKYLGWPVLASTLKMVPRFIRNPIYDFVARKRYQWFGKKESCMIPTPEIKSKFL